MIWGFLKGYWNLLFITTTPHGNSNVYVLHLSLFLLLLLLLLLLLVFTIFLRFVIFFPIIEACYCKSLLQNCCHAFRGILTFNTNSIQLIFFFFYFLFFYNFHWFFDEFKIFFSIIGICLLFIYLSITIPLQCNTMLLDDLDLGWLIKKGMLLRGRVSLQSVIAGRPW